MQSQISLGEILNNHGESYISRNNIPGHEKGLIRLLSACRSGFLGTHYEKCNRCTFLAKVHNSCRNRHCPLCQQKDKQEWLAKRMQELLPVGYYHLVFTIPVQLNELCIQNKKLMYDILFRAASETILELSKDTKHLGADTGLISVLHTWGQNMMEHPHLHCIMPAGGLAFDKSHWVHIHNNKKFFIHYKVLSRIFRGKFLYYLRKARDNGQLVFNQTIANLSRKKHFDVFHKKLIQKEWVVNIQPPFGSAKKVLEYLSRYVFRIAITNRRIIEVKDGKVHVSWKDYRTGRFRILKLEIDEFIRRFLLHILPKGFFKVRYYGIFSSRFRKSNVELAKQLLNREQQIIQEENLEDRIHAYKKRNTIWDEIMQGIENYKQGNCPNCRKGRLKFAGMVPIEKIHPG